MRKESIALENGIDFPQIRFGGGNVAAVKDHLSGIGLFETADNPEKGGFPAAGGTEDGEELTAGNGEGEIPYHGSLTEGFGDPADLQNIGNIVHTDKPSFAIGLFFYMLP
jgi:hypothetical protein